MNREEAQTSHFRISRGWCSELVPEDIEFAEATPHAVRAPGIRVRVNVTEV